VTHVRLERAALAAVADRLAEYPFAFWRYGDSIGFEGLLAAAALLEEPRYEGWVHGAFKVWAGRAGSSLTDADGRAPGHAMCLAYERTGDDAVLDAAARLCDFLAVRRTVAGAFVSYERAPLRAPYGEAELTSQDAALLDDPGAGVFLNELHFGAVFTVHLGALIGERRLIDLAAEQIHAHLRLLQQPDGLLAHFWLEKTRAAYGVGWGRGQAWALLGLMIALNYLSNEHPRYDEIHAAAKQLAVALARYQQESGGWPMVVNIADSPSESSTSAFAAAAFAYGVEREILRAEFADRARAAWQHAWANVDESGVLDDVSVNVGASTVASHYARTPKGSLVPWGQGPLLVAAEAIDGLDP
jgi:unsaturated rhamnogalacturonyl hydrolase